MPGGTALASVKMMGGLSVAVSGTGGVAGLSGCATAGENEGGTRVNRKLDRYGLQLSTITPLLIADFEGTLQRVAQIGYKEVEFSAAGFLGRPVEQVAEWLAKYNLQAPVGRISPKLPDGFGALSAQEQRAAYRKYAGPDYLIANVEQTIKDATYLGQRHINLPAMMPASFGSAEMLNNSLGVLRTVGRMCREADIQFGYHNHDWEFRSVEGRVPFDVMLEEVDADLLAIQMDVYWVTKGGRDPIDYFKRYPGRFPNCHLKDITPEGDFEDVGYGTLDFPAIVAAAQASGTAHYFVERDNPPQPLRTAERGFAYLQEMTY